MIGTGIRPGTDQRIPRQIFQMAELISQVPEFGPSKQNLPKSYQRRCPKGTRGLKWSCNRRAVKQPFLQRINRLRSGIVEDAQPNARVPIMESTQPFQQKQIQCGLTRTDGNNSLLHANLSVEFFFTKANLFDSSRDMVIKPFSFRGQGNAAVGTDEQLAAEFMFKNVHAPCDIGLVVIECFSSTGKAGILGNGVKNPVIVICDSQKTSFLPILQDFSPKISSKSNDKLLQLPYKKYIISISKILFTLCYNKSIL